MISTENAGGLLGSPNATGTRRIRMLIGTRVESLGRDTKVGEIVDVSVKDASFLIPYNYATLDLEEAVEADESVSTDETVDDSTEDESDAETVITSEVVVSPAPAVVAAPTGRRTGRRNR